MGETNWWEESDGGDATGAGATAARAQVDQPTIDRATVPPVGGAADMAHEPAADVATVPGPTPVRPHDVDRSAAPVMPTGDGGEPAPESTDVSPLAKWLAVGGVVALGAFIAIVLNQPLVYERWHAFDADPYPAKLADWFDSDFFHGNQAWWMLGACVAAVVAAGAGLRALRGRTTWLFVLASAALAGLLVLSYRPAGHGEALTDDETMTLTGWAVGAGVAAAIGIAMLFAARAVTSRGAGQVVFGALAVGGAAGAVILAAGATVGDPADRILDALEPIELTRCTDRSSLSIGDVSGALLVLSPGLGLGLDDPASENENNADYSAIRSGGVGDFVDRSWRLTGPSQAVDLRVQVGWPTCPRSELFQELLGPEVIEVQGLATLPDVGLFDDGYVLYVDGRVVVADRADLGADGLLSDDADPDRDGDGIANLINNDLERAGSSLEITAVP